MSLLEQGYPLEVDVLQESAQKLPVEVVYCTCGHGSWGFVSLVASAGGLWLYLQLHSHRSIV